jgi:hypothetical protein
MACWELEQGFATGGMRFRVTLQSSNPESPMSPLGQKRPFRSIHVMSAIPPILLQKSNVAAPRIFRENKMRETITDSYTLNRVAEVAGEFNARGSLPSRLYTKIALATRRIFEHQCKTTFATVSATFDQSAPQQLAR